MGKLYVVRHADAGTRGQSEVPDELRGLTERGQQQAEALRDQLGDLGIARLVSSPYRRCTDTLVPLATHLRIDVEADERLAEGRSFVEVLALAEELRGAPAAICSHGDVIPDLLEALLRRGLKLRDELRWQKASTWVLTRDADGFAKGAYLPPPA